MTKHLGYERYAAHGGDWGSAVPELLGRDHGPDLVGMHLPDVPFFHAFRKPSDPSHAEKQYLEAISHFPETQGAYALVQGSQPDALALALGDSPIGLAGWIIEKFRRWSDCGGDVESRFTKDELLTNVMLYWVTGAIGSSFLPYYDFSHAGAMTWIGQKLKEWTGSSHVPAAFAMLPKDPRHRRANGQSASSTCSDGRRCRAGGTSRRSRNLPCSRKTFAHSSARCGTRRANADLTGYARK